MSATQVRSPGSRGGKGYYDEHNIWRYGQRPTGARRQQYPASSPEQPAPPPPPAEGMEEHPAHREFGRWSPDATKVYLTQALRFAPCITNVIDRYLDMVSRYGLGAAAEAMKLVAPEDVPAATSALGRIRRLARWDRYGRILSTGGSTPLPSGVDPDPPSTAANPFVRAAMNAGMPQDAALLWQQLALRAMNRQHTGSLEDVLLAKHADDPRAIWLLKAVMKPGSRGGHVYWKNGRLHYGIPSAPAARARGGSGGIDRNPPPGPSRLALALMRQGRRVQYTDHSGARAWGDIVTATGDILAVLPDNARPYDLLHTVCVPVQAVLKVRPDRDDQEQTGQIMEKSDGNTEAPLGGQPTDPQPDDGPPEDPDPLEAFQQAG